MSGKMMIMVGAGMVLLSIVLFFVGIIYGSTSGKRIREELDREYS